MQSMGDESDDTLRRLPFIDIEFWKQEKIAADYQLFSLLCGSHLAWSQQPRKDTNGRALPLEEWHVDKPGSTFPEESRNRNAQRMGLPRALTADECRRLHGWLVSSIQSGRIRSWDGSKGRRMLNIAETIAIAVEDGVTVPTWIVEAFYRGADESLPNGYVTYKQACAIVLARVGDSVTEGTVKSQVTRAHKSGKIQRIERPNGAPFLNQADAEAFAARYSEEVSNRADRL
jgi:hypothetical protein